MTNDFPDDPKWEIAAEERRARERAANAEARRAMQYEEIKELCIDLGVMPSDGDESIDTDLLARVQEEIVRSHAAIAVSATAKRRTIMNLHVDLEIELGLVKLYRKICEYLLLLPIPPKN